MSLNIVKAQILFLRLYYHVYVIVCFPLRVYVVPEKLLQVEHSGDILPRRRRRRRWERGWF